MEYTILSSDLIILNTTERLEVKLVKGYSYGEVDRIYLGDTLLFESKYFIDGSDPKWQKARKQLRRIMNLIAEDLAKGKRTIDIRKYQNWKYVRKD